MKLRLHVAASADDSFPLEYEGAAASVGRDPGCELPLAKVAADVVSWRHARIELTPGGAYLSDLGSTNGTFVNDRRVTSRVSLREGAYIRLGATGPTLHVIRIDLTPSKARPRPARASAPAPVAPRPPARPADPSPVRRAVAAPGRGRRFPWFVGAAAAVVVVVGLAVWFRPKGAATTNPATNPAPTADSDLAEKGYAVLKKNCYRCHGQEFKKPGLDMNDRATLTAARKGKSFLSPGKPEESLIWDMADSGEMPPPEEETADRPTAEEKQTLKQWIQAGATFPPSSRSPHKRPFKGEKDVIAAIGAHLRAAPPDKQPFLRYFTLTNLWNSPRVGEKDLRLERAALAKAVNSLSLASQIVPPRAVDADETLYAVDLRDLQWEQNGLWDQVRAAYPYGLGQESASDAPLREQARFLYRECHTPLPYVRADWFIATATQPPLYDRFLDLPAQAALLEERLQVNVRDDFLHDRLQRAAFTASGVSHQNRMIERHATGAGAYWKSYDFKSSAARANLAQFPLGPHFPEGNPFDAQAFEQAGGEIIFNLPNGLQGYLLVDSTDKTIPRAPIEVVHDDKETAGTTQIVNGLSCMGCHKTGVIHEGVKDEVRDDNSVPREARIKVEALYPQRAVMDRLFADDERRFVDALTAATKGLLKPGEETEEPIGYGARRYLKEEIGLDEAAVELGLEDARKLQGAIQGNKTLRETLGLGPLTQGNKIKREAWDTLRDGLSPFQQAAEQLDLGTAERR